MQLKPNEGISRLRSYTRNKTSRGTKPETFEARTELAAGVPEGLRVEIGGVHSVRAGVDAGELPLVELDEGRRFLLHQLVSFGLAQRRHLPAAARCHGKHKHLPVYRTAHFNKLNRTREFRSFLGMFYHKCSGAE